jgi:hypothetical protein
MGYFLFCWCDGYGTYSLYVIVKFVGGEKVSRGMDLDYDDKLLAALSSENMPVE